MLATVEDVLPAVLIAHTVVSRLRNRYRYGGATVSENINKLRYEKESFHTSSVRIRIQLNPDPPTAKNLNPDPDPDPSYFIIIRFSPQNKPIDRENVVKSKIIL